MIKIQSAQLNNIPTILVVFGITGDLATRKIIPSLWRLFEQGLLGDRFSVIGFSRGDVSNDKFKSSITSAIRNKSTLEISEEELSRFVKLFSYHTGKFEDAAAFRTLAQSIDTLEKSWGVCANKLFYLAAPPVTYKPIFENLAGARLNVPCGGKLGWSRVLIEKPFGTDLASAQNLQSLLLSYFKEEQIYRIDHYLFKEIVQGIENFRFSNNLFENTWDNMTIERIDIRLYESIGVEGRGNFYDAVGALRDVGQNHLLEMLATLLMEYPAGKDTNVIRKNRTEIIQGLMPWTKKTIQENTFRAQYDGYDEIDGVRRDSNTETYFALKTELTLSRWKNIPIFMEAGKRMAEARKEIIVTLKHPKECLLCEVSTHRPNQIVFRLEPNDEIIIYFWTKKPGFDQVLEERVFSFFLYEKEVKIQYVAEYAKVVYAAIHGEQTAFVSPNEIEAAWKFIDPVVNVWNQGTIPLTAYKQGAMPEPLFIQNIVKDTRHRGKSQGGVGIVGLGKMGGNIARRLIEKQWSVVGFNKTPGITKNLESVGLRGAYSFKELVEVLQKLRTIWLMVPHEAVDEVLRELTPLLSPGDTVIDGGNSPYKESIRHAKELAKIKIDFLDVGVSGGPAGARSGACLMVGGKKELYQKHEQLFKDLAVPGGLGYMGKSGAGHFVKMVHNGIEYGMMQAIAEGFTVLKKAKYKLNLDQIAEVYNRGSVIESRLVGWLKNAFQLHGNELKEVSGSVSHTGEGAWTVKTAKELKVKTKIIKEALKFRIQSAKNPNFTGKVLSALREQFGGHSIKSK